METRFTNVEDSFNFMLSCLGEFEPLLTTYHYYVGCGNEVHNAEDKLTEIFALQQGVEVGYHDIKLY